MNQKIENVLLEHNISRLCHMTQIDKLFSILYGDTGIWANDFYEGTSMYRMIWRGVMDVQNIFRHLLSIQMYGITTRKGIQILKLIRGR